MWKVWIELRTVYVTNSNVSAKYRDFRTPERRMRTGSQVSTVLTSASVPSLRYHARVSEWLIYVVCVQMQGMQSAGKLLSACLSIMQANGRGLLRLAHEYSLQTTTR
jgi:hypothetical protein